VRFAAAVLSVGTLTGCGSSGSGGAGDADQIRSAIIASASIPDLATCSKVFTDDGIKQFFREDSPEAAKKDCAKEAGNQQNKDRGKQLTITDVSVTGATASASASLKDRKAVYKLVQQTGSWKIDGISEAAGGSSSSSSTTTGSTTTTTDTTSTATASSASSAVSRATLDTAATDYNAGLRRFLARGRPDAVANNVPALKADVSQFRDVVFNFDTAVRKISPPDAARTEYTAVLEASRTTIADLDAIGSTSDGSEIGRLLKSRIAPDTQTLIASEKALYNGL
jgi:hypothetical protein